MTTPFPQIYRGNVHITAGTNTTLYGDGQLKVDSKLAINTTISPSAIVNISGATQIDNLNLLTNTISSTDTNGHINLIPNGVGEIRLKADPIVSLGAATKQYVDNSITHGIRDPVRAKTIAALPAYTKTGTGIGAFLEATVNGLLPTIDGVTLIVNDRILVDSLGSTTDVDNGIYSIVSIGSAGTKWKLTRTIDSDESTEVLAGQIIPISEGTLTANTIYQLTTNGIITLDTTAIVYTALSGGSGETNTASNLGVGTGVFGAKVGVDLRFKSLIGGTGITLSSTANDITVTSIPDYEILLSSSASSPVTSGITEIQIDTSSGLKIRTLANGTTIGEEKTILVSSKTGSDNYQLNITTFINGTSITYSTAGQSTRLVWTGVNGWCSLGGSGGVLI